MSSTDHASPAPEPDRLVAITRAIAYPLCCYFDIIVYRFLLSIIAMLALMIVAHATDAVGAPLSASTARMLFRLISDVSAWYYILAAELLILVHYVLRYRAGYQYEYMVQTSLLYRLFAQLL